MNVRPSYTKFALMPKCKALANAPVEQSVTRRLPCNPARSTQKVANDVRLAACQGHSTASQDIDRLDLRP